MKLLTGVFAGERSHGLLKKVGYRVREVLGRGKCVFIEMMKWWEGSRNGSDDFLVSSSSKTFSAVGLSRCRFF